MLAPTQRAGAAPKKVANPKNLEQNKRSKTLAAVALSLLGGAVPSCAPKKATILRDSSEEQADRTVMITGKFPQLNAPSVSMRSACARMNVGIDCAKFPWSIEDYNKIAALVDAASEWCTHQVYVKSDAPASLLNQGNSEGTAVTTVFQGSVLEVVGPDIPGSVSFMQVKYTDAQLKSFGNTANAEPPVYIERSSVTCQIPKTATHSSLDDSESERGLPASTTGSPSSTMTDSSAKAGPLATSQAQQQQQSASTVRQPKPAQVPRMMCQVNIPLHARLLVWLKPKCEKIDGTVIQLERQETVVVKRSPEAGTPVTYLETNRNCYIKSENIQIKTCSPL